MKRNKRKLAVLLAIMLCIALGLLFAACTYTPQLTVDFDSNHNVYEGDTLDSLKPYLTVKYSDSNGAVSTVSDYVLKGTLSKGECAVVVSYKGIDKTVMITVLEKPSDTYTVTFKADGVIVGIQRFTADDKNITEPQLPTKTGYVGKWEDYELTDSDITVNAIYTAKSYVVKFDYNGATDGNTQQSVTVTYDKSVGALPLPSRTDYKFAGWYLDGKEITSNTVWKVDSDTQLTLVAKWERDKGTLDNPYMVDEAVALTNALENNQCTDEQVYVIGIVSTEPTLGLEGDYLFHITDEEYQTDLYIYYASCNIIGVDSIKVGDIVIVYGYLCNYNGNTPEMKKNNNVKPQIVWIYQEAPSEEKGTFDNPYTASEALELANALADNAHSESPVYVKGTITGTITEGNTAGDFKFTITDDTGYIFTIYYASLPSSVASKIEVGDTVIVYGYLYKYVSSYGSTPEMADYNGVNCTIVSVVKANVPNDGEVTLSISKNFIEVNEYANLTVTPYDYESIEYIFLSGQNYISRVGFSLIGESKGIVVLQVKIDGVLSNTVQLQIVDPNDDPYTNTVSNWFHGSNYNEADSLEDAYWRTKHNLMSGSIADQDQAPTISSSRPKSGNKYVRNSDTYFVDNGNTYEVVDSRGNVVNLIYKFGAYVTLDDVAVYVYAFGDVPANYSSNKYLSPTSSNWGKWLRVNNTYYSGDTTYYPYEPVMPRIDGVYIDGAYGDLQYYEIDIGTTGTDCDPRYDSVIYNDGTTITRGAARIVYTRYYSDGSVIEDLEDRYVFYTYNHYNDFQEYLNYQGGWGEMFGNITGGGKISSKSDYNPTPYVDVVRQNFSQLFN